MNGSAIRLSRLACALIVMGLFTATPAKAELTVSLFSGKSITDDGDLTLKQDGTNLHFKDVRWNDRSFEDPIYYGARIGYWFDAMPNWGVSVDFTHAKTYLYEGDAVRVSGVRGGAAVNGVEPINNSVQHFAMSHGLNMITFNGLHRWFPAGKRDQTLLGRMQLYTGLGMGFSVPHVEADVGGVNTDRFDWGTGAVVNGMMGVNYDLYGFLSGFLEYKLSYNDVQADLKGGGSISAESVTHQIVFGLSGRFDL
ncbi:MAG: hypothetical protein PHE55_20395 [Methylococcaceae bacterium]|nr:hypothetical protein [Methylococcaceae bacterium]